MNQYVITYELKVILSVITYAWSHNKKLTVIWMLKNSLNSDFLDLYPLHYDLAVQPMNQGQHR